ncbi:unnamed protein product, partial [Vitis vinifera]
MANLYLITLFKHPLLWLYHEMVAALTEKLAFSAVPCFLSSASLTLAFSSDRLCSFNMAASSSLLNSSTFLANSSSFFVCSCSFSSVASISPLLETGAEIASVAGFMGFLVFAV